MREQLLALADRFQPFLENGDYVYVHPTDPNLFAQFLRRANDLAPAVGIFRSVHHALGNREATRVALNIFPANTPLEISVIERRPGDDDIVRPVTIEVYCIEHNIDFNVE